jgi:hypothetical protein
MSRSTCGAPERERRKDRAHPIRSRLCDPTNPSSQFACHLQTCQRVFSNPKTRRLHLIDTHAYPKEYFFAVTNKGVGGLLKKWGDGASMLRREWKDRDGDGDDDVKGNEMETDQGIPAKEATATNGDSYSDTTPAPPQPKNKPKQPQTAKLTTDNDQLDGLTSSMTSLSLVPPSIRFGRGGKSGGFGNGNLNGQAEPQSQSQSQSQSQNQSVDPQPAGNAGANNVLGRGRGRGRGRGFIHPPVNGNHNTPASAPNSGVARGGFVGRGSPAGRAGIINVVPGRGRGRGVPRGRGRGGPLGPI